MTGVTVVKGPFSCLNEADTGSSGAPWPRPATPTRWPWTYALHRELRPPDRLIQLTQAKLVDMALEIQRGVVAPAHRRLKDAGTLRPEQISFGKLNNVREAIAIYQGGPYRARRQRRDPGAVAASAATWRACAPTRAPLGQI